MHSAHTISLEQLKLHVLLVQPLVMLSVSLQRILNQNVSQGEPGKGERLTHSMVQYYRVM